MVNNMNMKQILIFLLIITLYAVDLSAQSKPKRDISKDKSVILAKKKEAQKAAEKENERKKLLRLLKTLPFYALTSSII